MRRRWVGAVVVVVALAGACSSQIDRDVPSVSRPDGLFVPRSLPPGSRVVSATAAGYRSGKATNTLFAPAGRFEPGKPAVLVGLDGEDDAMPLGEPDTCSVPGLGIAAPSGIERHQCPAERSSRVASGYGELGHFGGFTVIFWEAAVDQDTPYMVARGLTDAQSVQIARSMRVTVDDSASIRAVVPPRGWAPVASAPPLPRQTLRAPFHVAVVRSGNRRTDVLAYRLSAGATKIDEFVGALQRASQHAQLGWVGAEKHFGSTTVLVITRAPDPTLEMFARSIVSVKDDDWRRFQAAK